MIAKKNLPCSWLLASALLALPSLRASLPITTTANLTVGYPSTAGVVTASTSGGTGAMTITSSAPITVLTWGNFWDGTANGGTSTSADSIAFSLPAATSSILNVVAGTGTSNPTTINGTITSIGKVFILNPNGITIGATGNINAAGFYASTILENISYFEQTGNLQVFTSTPPVSPTGTGITVTNGGVISVGSGDIRLAGNGITLGGGTITGNVYLVDMPSATPPPAAVNLATGAAQTITGNLAITSNGAAVTLSDGFSTSVSGNLTITSAGGNVDLAPTAATTTTIGGTSSITTTGTTNGSVSAPNGTFVSGATNIVTGTGSSATDGTVSIGALQLGSNPITITGGTTMITDTTDTTLTIGNSTISGNLTLSTTGNLTTQNFGSTAATPAVVTLTGNTSTLGLTADSGSAGGKTLSFNGSGAENFTTLSMGGLGASDSATITTTGNITLNTGDTVLIPTLSLATTTGTITEGATTDVQGNSLTVNAPTVTLNTAINAENTLVLIGGGTSPGISFTEENGDTLVIGNGTSTTGNVSITNGNSGGGNDSISLGASNTDVLSFGGNLSLNLTNGSGVANEQILTAAGTVTVSGKTTITSSAEASTISANSVALGTSGGTDTFTGPIVTTINGGVGGDATYYGTTGIILGATGLNGGNLTVTSSLTGTGNTGISNPSGVISGIGQVTLAAGTAVSPSNIQIGGTANPAALANNIEVDTANNLSLTNSTSTTIVAGTNPIAGQTTITQTGNGAASAVAITDSLAKLSIADTGTAPTGSVAVTIPTGNVALSNWTVGGDATVTVGVTATDGSITLGSGINDSNLSTTTFTASAGIADTASSPVLIYGAVTFSSAGPINISNNTSSSLGGITLDVTGSSNSNVTYTEGSGVNLQGITVPAGYTGTIAVTSVNSIVLETGASVLALPATATLTLTANSANGAVLLNAVGAANSILASTSLTTTGNSAIEIGDDLTLGNVNVSAGSLTIGTAGVAADTITEPTGVTLSVAGAASFVTNGGVISVNQTGNKFGSLAVDTTDADATPAGAAATIKQYTDSVYTSVNTGTGGAFSATSETGSLTETGNTGVVEVGGVVTLAAPSGSVTFNSPGNNFSGEALVITTNGNAAITDSNGVTQLGGGTDVTGSLTVTNSNAGGIIKDNGLSGNITIGGTGIFLLPTSGTGDVSFTGVDNSIAGLEIKAGSGTTTFYDNANLELEPGTVVIGPATIASGGTITTASGPMTFGAGVNFNANSSITLSNTGLTFSGQVTAVVTGASSDVSFSALSLATNFNGIAPIVTTTNNATLYQPPGP